MRRVVTIVILVGVVMGFKFYNKSKAGREIKAEAISQIDRTLPDGVDVDYVHELVDHAHPMAMDKAYKMGGRRKNDEFDSQAYRTELFAQMARKADLDGKRVVAALFAAQSGPPGFR